MIETTLLKMYSRAMQNMDRKLSEMDRKIEHIIFRLREMDPRIRPGRGREADELDQATNDDCDGYCRPMS